MKHFQLEILSTQQQVDHQLQASSGAVEVRFLLLFLCDSSCALNTFQALLRCLFAPRIAGFM